MMVITAGGSIPPVTDTSRGGSRTSLSELCGLLLLLLGLLIDCVLVQSFVAADVLLFFLIF